MIERDSLGLTVLAGSKGLNRPVSWAHVSELEDPTPWLQQDQMVLTAGIGLPATDEEQVAYLQRLQDRGVAALAVGEQLLPNRNKPQPTMLAVADRLGFPVLRVSDNVAFIAIVQSVADASHAVTRRRLMPYLYLLDAMRLRTEAVDGSKAMFSRLEEVTGYDLVLVSPAGIDLLGNRLLAPEIIAALPTAVSNQRLASGYAVPVVVDSRPAAYLVATEHDRATGAGLTVVQHVATLARFEMLEIFRQRESQRHAGGRLLRQLLEGNVIEGATEQLSELGITPDQGMVTYALRPTTGSLDEAEVDHYLHDHAVAHLVMSRDRTVFALILSGKLPADVVTDLGVHIGSAAPRSALKELVFAGREATWALENATMSGGIPHRQFGSGSDDYWLPADLPLLRALTDSVLGPLMRYDHQHGTELMRSLTTYFHHDRSLNSSAEALFIHKHTLAYRLRRIGDLTGRDVNNVADGAQFWLALRAQAALGDDHEAPQDV